MEKQPAIYRWSDSSCAVSYTHLFGILDDGKRIAFLYLLEIREPYLTDEALHTAALRLSLIHIFLQLRESNTAVVKKFPAESYRDIGNMPLRLSLIHI